MVCLNPSAYFRPVWYTLSRMSTVTRNPVVVCAFSISHFTNATLLEDHPLTGTSQVAEQPVLDRVVLRAIRRVVRHPDLHPHPSDQPLQVLLEQVRGWRCCCPPPSHSSRIDGRPRVQRPPVTLPPALDAVAGELAGVVAGAQVHVAAVALHVVQPVRDDHARGGTGEVVVERLDRLLV